MAAAHDRAGDALAAGGARQEALTVRRTGLRLRQRLAEGPEARREDCFVLAIAWDRVGDAEAALDRLEPALDAYRAALAIRLDLAAGRRSDVAAARALALSHGRIAMLLLAAGERDGAREALRTGRGVLEGIDDKTAIAPDAAWFDARLAELGG